MSGAISVARVSAVLIAEPQPDVRGFLERHLAQDGFDVVGTEDGDAALELALRAHPDLVLLGDATAVESFRGVPVIVIGGEDSDAIDRVRAFARGCDDFVARPFVYDELVARINAVLRRARPPRSATASRPGRDLDRALDAARDRRRRPRRPRCEGVRAAAASSRATRSACSRRRSCCARSGASGRSAGRARSTRTRHGCAASCRRSIRGRSSSTCGASGTGCWIDSIPLGGQPPADLEYALSLADDADALTLQRYRSLDLDRRDEGRPDAGDGGGPRGRAGAARAHRARARARRSPARSTASPRRTSAGGSTRSTGRSSTRAGCRSGRR